MHAQASLFDWSPGRVVAAAPEPARKKPRPYQLQALAGIREKLAEYRSTLVSLFTGGGKTFIAGQVALEAPGRVMFLADRDNLVEQGKSELEALTGQAWEREQAGDYAMIKSDRNVVASIQSLMKPIRYQRFAPDAFSRIIVDEAHHYVTPGYSQVLDYFTGAKLVGLTATPFRRDKKAMGRVFDSVAFKMDLVDGIDDGWLVPIECKPPIALDVNLDDLRVSKGDFVEAELEEKIKEVIGPVCSAAMEYTDNWPTAIFTPRVESAHASARALNNLRAGCAQAIDGTMDRTTKRLVIKAFKRQAFQYLANCGVLVEGFDYRGLVCMIDAAPTLSLGRCVQKVGRILRPDCDVDSCATAEERKALIAASSKPTAIWIDLKFNSSRHEKLQTPLDVLGGSYSDKERKAAKKIIEKKGGDARGALEQARKKIADAANRAKVRMELGSFDPTKKARRAPAADPSAFVSGKQIDHARREFGFAMPATWTRAEASTFIKYEYVCRKAGLCNWQRREKLALYGIAAKGMSVAKGAKLWAALGRNGWKRLTNDQYYQALATSEPGSEG